jgi:hypothetical protein
MTKIATCFSALAVVLLTAPAARAESCTQKIARVQAQADAAIERRADADGWKVESLNALRSYQPTPRSIAATEAVRGRQFYVALDALDRARDADRSGYMAVCRHEVARARAALRRQ